MRSSCRAAAGANMAGHAGHRAGTSALALGWLGAALVTYQAYGLLPAALHVHDGVHDVLQHAWTWAADRSARRAGGRHRVGRKHRRGFMQLLAPIGKQTAARTPVMLACLLLRDYFHTGVQESRAGRRRVLTSQVTRLCDVPNQEDWYALPLGHLQQRGGALPHLGGGARGRGRKGLSLGVCALPWQQPVSWQQRQYGSAAPT